MAAHELGHALGLGHTTAADNIMFKSLNTSGISFDNLDIFFYRYLWGY